MRILILLLSAMWVGDSFSSELVEAWEWALKKSPEILAATEKYNVDYEAKEQALAHLLPSLQGVIHYQEQPQSNANDSTIQGWSIELTQTLINISKWRQYKKGTVRSVIADLELQDARRQLLNKVTEVYFDILQLKKDLELIEKAKESMMAQVKQTEALYMKGAGTVIDFYDAQSAYEEIEAEELSVYSKLEVGLRKLSAITNRPYHTLENKKIIVDGIELLTLGYWRQAALSENSTLKVKSELINEAEHEVKAIKALHLPSIDLSLGYQDSINKRDAGAGGNIKYPTRGRYANLRLTIPFFSGGGIASETRSAVASREMLYHEYSFARENVMLQIEGLFLDVRNNQRQIKAFSQLVDTNLVKLEATRVGFKAGVRTLVDIIRAEKDYLEAQRNLAKVQYQIASNYIMLQTLSGEVDLYGMQSILDKY